MFGNYIARRLGMVLFAVTAACLLGASADPGRADRTTDCEGGARKVTNFGLWNLDAKMNIGVWGRSEHAMRTVRFLSEPVIGAVDPEGPSYGKVKEGDVLVAIGGELITTEPAGFIFATAPAGIPVELTLRRDGVEKKVTVVPTEICENDPRSFMSRLLEPLRVVHVIRGTPDVEPQPVPSTPSMPKPERSEPVSPLPPGDLLSPQPPREPMGFPHPWMGIGLRCSIEGNWYSKDLRFTEPPTIFRLEPGSNAEKAGLERGDVITEIDGIPLDTLEGTEHFVNIKPGDTVEWTVLRDGRRRTVDMVAEPIPRWAKYLQQRAEGITEADTDALRYSGVLGETAIEVRGAAPVNVTVNNELGLITIRTPDTTIRLEKVEKRDEK
jgi:hypothetical protein